MEHAGSEGMKEKTAAGRQIPIVRLQARSVTLVRVYGYLLILLHHLSRPSHFSPLPFSFFYRWLAPFLFQKPLFSWKALFTLCPLPPSLVLFQKCVQNM